MRIAVPNESSAAERRVSLVPEVVGTLAAQGHQIRVESGAGAGARIPDGRYEQAGATIASGVPVVRDAESVLRERLGAPAPAS
jgi:NAD/NADP transhydrogenase alpha subunit